MSLTAEEIADQPRAWSLALKLGRETPELFPTGERIAVIGCGSSWHAAKAVAALRELNGQGETDAFAASEALLERRYDRVVVISRSGETTEISRALRRVTPATPTVALVADTESPVASACDRQVDLSFAGDRAIVQSRFVSSVTCLVRASLGLGVDDLVEDAEGALAESIPGDPAVIDRVVVLGREWRVGLADAGALMLQETAQVWAESYPAMEYRHGPIANAGPGALVWMLDEPPANLVDEVASTGAEVVTPKFDPLAELIRVQRLGLGLAKQRGLDPDRPANIERVVLLDSGEPGGAT